NKKEQFLPNSSLHFVKYELEIKRYGGSVAIKVAEQHFHNSSEIVLKIRSQSSTWNYERAMGEAIRLHLSFVHALGMKIHDAKQFFYNIYKKWFQKDKGKNKLSLSRKKKKKTLGYF